MLAEAEREGRTSLSEVEHLLLQVLKELLTQIFVTPRKHRRSKPFIDHILYFGFFDNRIWFRNYQVADKEGLPTGSRANTKTLENLMLVEVGPRCCMNPIRIFSSSFKGATLYENEDYISPSAVSGTYTYAKAPTAKRRMAEIVCCSCVSHWNALLPERLGSSSLALYCWQNCRCGERGARES